MEWIKKVSRIVCINLTKRTDRLIQFTSDMEDYSIPFERFQAVENNNGAEGLRLTMVELFEDCLSKDMENCLVFEDDNYFVVPPPILHDTMNNILLKIPENYLMVFLGCQLTGRISGFYSPNLIKASKMFSTHSVLYSRQGMKEILSRNFFAPIDNFYVQEVEALGGSYAAYPLLTCQRPGYSDIGKNNIDWSPFILSRYDQKIGEYNSNGQR